MLPDPDLLLMLPDQLTTDHVTIFGDDPNEAIDVFGVIPNEFGEFL
jgi:hypothetical protein